MAEDAERPILQRLRTTLVERPPFCSGTLGVPDKHLRLYYGKGVGAREVNLAGKSTGDVDALCALAAACEAASFGRDIEDDRKAGKMDPENFLLGLDVRDSGLVDVVSAGLLSGEQEKDVIRAELYKLNVYGKGAFFKPHQDTQRGEHMFGSLVVVFPTPHEGGAFALRHEGQEWKIDAAAMLSAHVDPVHKRIAYIAFFSDVDHEVLPVTSGHRVTITYNLYWVEPPPVHPPVQLPKELTVLYPKLWSGSTVKDVLAELIADPTFLPDGGVLGFALHHAYPFPRRWEEDMSDPLEDLVEWLKGSDAALSNALKAFSLKPYLRLVHSDEEDQHNPVVLLQKMIKLRYDSEMTETETLCSKHGGVRAISVGYDGVHEVGQDIENDAPWWSDLPNAPTVDVFWVTGVAEEGWNSVVSTHGTYGDGVGTRFLYLTPSLFAQVAPAGQRKKRRAAADEA